MSGTFLDARAKGRMHRQPLRRQHPRRQRHEHCRADDADPRRVADRAAQLPQDRRHRSPRRLGPADENQTLARAADRSLRRGQRRLAAQVTPAIGTPSEQAVGGVQHLDAGFGGKGHAVVLADEHEPPRKAPAFAKRRWRGRSGAFEVFQIHDLTSSLQDRSALKTANRKASADIPRRGFHRMQKRAR